MLVVSSTSFEQMTVLKSGNYFSLLRFPSDDIIPVPILYTHLGQKLERLPPGLI